MLTWKLDNHRWHGKGVYLSVLLVGGVVFLGLTFASTRHTINPAFPFFHEAVRRAGLGLGGAIILLVSATALGSGISRVFGWRYAGWNESLPFSAALGIGVFSYLGFALALVGLYRPLMLQIAVTVVLLAAILVFAFRSVNGGIHYSVRKAPHGTDVLWLTCAGLALLCTVVAALAPESRYDALWFHLAYPQRFLEAGYLVDTPSDFVSLYPMITELWFGYGLALGGVGAATLLHFGFLLLAAVLTYKFARQYAPSASPGLAVALLVTIPTIIWLGSTAYIDLAVMLFVTLALYALLRYVDTTQRQWLLLAALNLGLALASKHLALLALVLFCPGFMLALRYRKATWRAAFLAAFMLGALSLLIALPWYIRSYLASGNPVFQLLYPVFGAPPARWNVQTDVALRSFLDSFGRPRTVENLARLPWDMTMHARFYDGTLGPLFLALLPMLALQRMRGALPYLLLFATLYILLWASPVSSFQMRHIMLIVPVLAILCAVAFGRATALARSAAGRRTQGVLAAVLAAFLIVNVPPFTLLHEGDRDNRGGNLSSVLRTLPLGVVTGGESTDAYLARQVPTYNVWKFADATLPADARVLTWIGGDHLYTHRQRISASSAPAITVTSAKVGQEEQALAGLRALGITHLLVVRPPDGAQEQWDAFALTGPFARANWYEELYSDQWYVLYRVRWEAIESAAQARHP